MNEALFLIHIFLVIGFVLFSLRLGKSGLVAFVALQAVLANVFVLKQMDLFGLSVTCSDVFAIGSILGLNLIQEYFGKDLARFAAKVSFLALLFFALMSQIHLLYEPATIDRTQAGFLAIFSSTPRIVFASIAVFYLVQKIDIRFFGWLQKISNGTKLPIRVGVSLVVSQFLDTALFTFLGLYGLVEAPFHIILVSFLVKCLVIACSAPLTALSKKIVRDPVS